MKNNKSLKATILSLSLLTIMGGAAVSPALGGIAEYFSDVNSIYIKMILTVPALFIIITSLLFHKISKYRTTKEIALTGLALYIIGGSIAGLSNSIFTLLLFRAVLGVGIGLLMPLSTGLISYYFKPDEQSTLLGYSAAMNNLGGIVAMILSGYLVSINWRYSFFVYFIGLVSAILVLFLLPNTKIEKEEDNYSIKDVSGSIFYFASIFLIMLAFYVFPTSFSLISSEENLIKPEFIGSLMALQTLAAFIIGLNYGRIDMLFREKTSYLGGVSLIAGYLLLATQNHIFIISLSIIFIGIGLGLLVPYLNKNLLASTKPENATTVMALMSASLYLGQFISPLLSQFLNNLINPDWIKFPYYYAMVISIILLGIFYLRNIKRKIH